MLSFFFFNDTATTEIYTLSLHDALPSCPLAISTRSRHASWAPRGRSSARRSEEHTSELQSHSDLVCRLLLEKKNKKGHGAERASTGTRDAVSQCGRDEWCASPATFA